MSVLGVITVLCLIVILIVWRQPQSKAKLAFKVRCFVCRVENDSLQLRLGLKGRPFSSQVPLLPFLPVASLFINVYLMMQLDRGTWMRFAVWMALGTSTVLTLMSHIFCRHV